MMRGRILMIIGYTLAGFAGKSQYYYKDIVLTRQNQANWKQLHDQKVRTVDIQSLDANNEKTAGFTCTQTLSSDFSSITTFTQSRDVPPSTLTTYYDQKGLLTKTVDTSDTYKSVTEYSYNEQGDLTGLVNHSVQTDNQVGATEKHAWIYTDGKIQQMIKIKDGTDTTFVILKKDEKGNVTEEKSTRNGQTMPSIYYYYDNDGRLTDIVRYSQKAARLLPDYVFEYKYDRISSMLFVRTGSTDYQKWIYTYATNGLKETETCYDKRRQVVVKIIYTYSLQ